MQQLIKDKLMKAYELGYLHVEDLVNLKSIDFIKSERIVSSIGGKIKYLNNARQYTITIYLYSIRKWFHDGCIFNGVKPKNYEHAIELVVEHEVGHIINHYHQRKGHDNTFKQIVKHCYGHTDWRIEDVGRINESNQAKDKENKDSIY